MSDRYHYVYRLDGPIGLYYIGIRSCDVPPEQDTYKGSGSLLRDFQKRGYVFRKTILKVCKSRREALDLEAELVTGRQVNDPKCLNQVCGGQNSDG